LANSRQSLLERFRWNTESSSDLVGSARTTVIRDLVIDEFKAFKQENNQKLKTSTDPDLVSNMYYFEVNYNVVYCNMQ